MKYFRSLVEILGHPLNNGRILKSFLRVFWWKCNQLLFGIPGIVQLTPEAKCICETESSYGGLVVYTKWPEYPTMNFIYQIAELEDIFIDVGANIGVYSLIAGSKISQGKVYAFEPTPSCLGILKDNISLNNLQMVVEVVEKVVSDTDGTEGFVFCKDSEVSHISYLNEGMRESVNDLRSISLDTFVSSRELPYIDIVKIDVEGAEHKVLQGFDAYLSSGKVGILIIEISTDRSLFGVKPTDVLSFLTSRDYGIYVLRRNNELHLMCPGDLNLNRLGNVVAVHNSADVLARIKDFNSKNKMT